MSDIRRVVLVQKGYDEDIVQNAVENKKRVFLMGEDGTELYPVLPLRGGVYFGDLAIEDECGCFYTTNRNLYNSMNRRLNYDDVLRSEEPLARILAQKTFDAGNKYVVISDRATILVNDKKVNVTDPIIGKPIQIACYSREESDFDSDDPKMPTSIRIGCVNDRFVSDEGFAIFSSYNVITTIDISREYEALKQLERIRTIELEQDFDWER